MAYLFLTLAIVLELIATSVLKYSEGFTKLYPTAVCISLYILCYFCLSKALLKLNLGIAYATWCGVGIIVTALVSVFVFKQGISSIGILGIILIVTGCILLNIWGNA